MGWSPCWMSKYILLVIFGPRAASADCAEKMAANDTTAKMRDVLAKIILGEVRKGRSSDGDERAFKDNHPGESEDATPIQR
jgi:hypothetical protein